MKKVAVLAAASRRDETLARLREVAVLHLRARHAPRPDEAARLRDEEREIVAALAIVGEGGEPGVAAPEEDGREIARRLLDLDARAREKREALKEKKRQVELLDKLGLSDPVGLDALAEVGVYTSVRLLRSGEDYRQGRLLCRDDQGDWIAIFSTHRDGWPPGDPVSLPASSRGALLQDIATLEGCLKELVVEINELGRRRGDLSRALNECRDARAFWEAGQAVTLREPVVAIEGYCPDSRLDGLSTAAREHGWALRVAEPGAADAVPTLLRNNRLDALFQPVMDYLGLTPGYQEFHPGAVFLIFFTVFFAMIIGDAGYGLLMLLVTLWLGKRKPPIPCETLALSALLALATMGWGTITGSWFGVRALADTVLLGWAVVPGLDAWREESKESVMRLCIGIGMGHLLVARAWAARATRGWRATAELGWGGIVAACGLAAFKLLLADGGWFWPGCLFVGGGLLIVLGGEQRDGSPFLVGVWRGVVNLPLQLFNFIGTFSDAVSYIRLFAVGLATLEVASAFNSMAAAIGWNSLASAAGAGVVVILGHTVNLLLAAMGVLVHGIRLNLLEFSRHLGMTWSGFPYDPFRPLEDKDLNP